jgi:hypothetical protein
MSTRERKYSDADAHGVVSSLQMIRFLFITPDLFLIFNSHRCRYNTIEPVPGMER